MKNGVLVVNVSDSDADYTEFMMFCAQFIKKFPDVAILGTLHVKEWLIKVSLGILAFGCELLLNGVPSVKSLVT